MSHVGFHHKEANKMAERFVGCQIQEQFSPLDTAPIKSQAMHAGIQLESLPQLKGYELWCPLKWDEI